MRRYYSLAIIVLMLSLLCSCSSAGFSSALSSPSASSSNASSSTDFTAAPSPSQTVLVDNFARAEIFRAFLCDNYEALSSAFFEGITGIGFIDLDKDGGIEMLLFDAGASAAMGLQFFDIIEDRVECVSANLSSVASVFGGKYMSSVVVNANSFQDFRLMQDKETGELFFIVNSGNGAADFMYSEIIRFGSTNGVLTLTSLLYLYNEYDIDSGAETGEIYKVNGEKVSAAEYSDAINKLDSGMTDLGYIAKGVFLSEISGIDTRFNFENMMAMADKALSLFGIEISS